jgi:hypothetical protein
VEDPGPNPPIIDYQSTLPASKDHRRAGIMMLIWSGMFFVIGLVIALWAVILVIGGLQEQSMLRLVAILLSIFLAFMLIVTGFSLIRLARRFLNHEVVIMDRMFDLIRQMELPAYLCGIVLLILSLATGVMFAIALSIPLLVAALALSYTRILLRRVKRFQEDRKSTSSS